MKKLSLGAPMRVVTGLSYRNVQSRFAIPENAVGI
jgi:hypothetical protein